MILVDASVWIDYFSGTDTGQTERLDRFLGRRLIATGDLILTEVLQGFRQDSDHIKAKKALLCFHSFDMLGTRLAIQSAENFRRLRQKGITIKKTAVVIIATFCIDRQIPLLFSDRDFEPFVAHLGLKTA